jgi:hypothetical protein
MMELEKFSDSLEVESVNVGVSTWYDTLAEAVIGSRELIAMGAFGWILEKRLGGFPALLNYACERGARGKKRTPVDINQSVEKWVPLIKKLALAHDVDNQDAASSALDEALLPIANAPVEQIRQFYRAFIERLKADEEVPWAVWRLFEVWGKGVFDNIKNEAVMELKKDFAAKIAERSMEDIPREDWVASMVGALQWRSPERLREIDAALDAGEKPRVKGKESCLFLSVGDKEVML